MAEKDSKSQVKAATSEKKGTAPEWFRGGVDHDLLKQLVRLGKEAKAK